MSLTKPVRRTYEVGKNQLPVKALTTIYEGAAVGVTVAGGLARPLDPADTFAGFAESTAENANGGDGSIHVTLRTADVIKLAIAGLALTDFGASVYAAGDNTFSLDPEDGPLVGKITRVILAEGAAMVAFNSAAAAEGEQGPPGEIGTEITVEDTFVFKDANGNPMLTINGLTNQIIIHDGNTLMPEEESS